MRRDLKRLESARYDLIVVGGGVQGAWLAREAARAGLATALLEAEDFASGLSANTQRVLHGGFRYLARLDIRRARTCTLARNLQMRSALHQTHPIGCLVPLASMWRTVSPMVRVALKGTDLLFWDRNRGLPLSHHLPPSRLLNRTECLEFSAGLAPPETAAGLLFYDGFVLNPERHVLELVRQAHQWGCEVANHVEVKGLLRSADGRLAGVRAKDRGQGEELEVRAKYVVDCASSYVGPWSPPDLNRPAVKVVNLVLTRPGSLSVNLSGQLPRRNPRLTGQDSGGRRLFATPWLGRLIAGSGMFWYGPHSSPEVREDEIEAVLADLALVWPQAEFRREEVCAVHTGLLPGRPASVEPVLSGRPRLVGPEPGLLLARGVKYTTAPKLAHMILARLGHHVPPESPAEEANPAVPGDLGEEVGAQLRRSYGPRLGELWELLKKSPEMKQRVCPTTTALEIQVSYAVHHEMALTLPDLVMRRLELGHRGHPGEVALHRCAELMARELGWSPARIQQEMTCAEAALRKRGSV